MAYSNKSHRKHQHVEVIEIMQKNPSSMSQSQKMNIDQVHSYVNQIKEGQQNYHKRSMSNKIPAFIQLEKQQYNQPILSAQQMQLFPNKASAAA